MSKLHTLLIAGIFLALALLPSQSSAAAPAPAISLLSPSAGAVLASPIHLTAEIQPEADGSVRVALINSSGIPIARQLLRLEVVDSAPLFFETELPFEIPTDTTEALLTLSLLDSYHRPQALRSALLTLTPDGNASLQGQAASEPWLTLTEPEPLATISGGQCRLQGIVIPQTGKPVIFELITDTGGVIGTAQLAVETPGEPADFDLTLYYDFITKARNVRLVVRQTADGYPTPVILDSLPLTVAP